MEKDKNLQEDIDTNLYSRQIGTFGMETMGKLIKLDVLIVGMRGVSKSSEACELTLFHSWVLKLQRILFLLDLIESMFGTILLLR